MLVIFCSTASAEEFVIKNIRVVGLERISLGTVLSNLPVKVGDSIDTAQTSDIIHALYETGFFSDVRLNRSNDDLVVKVVERAVIGTISASGNSKITKKQLLDALKQVGIFEGQPLDQSTLSAMKRAIIQQYYNFGLYNAKVNIEVLPKERHRVAIVINIQEGPVARIKSMVIVGNQSVKTSTLLSNFSLTTTRPWSFLTDGDLYSKEKLDADLEKMHSYYMDRGYLRMKVDATKVSITPDKKNIYIVVKITEGGVYRVGNVGVEGSFLGKKNAILGLVTVKTGSTFSQKELADIQTKINEFLGEYGYGMADTKLDYDDIDESQKRVNVKFIVNPGYRVYVRHINFSGNYKTNDEVLRREMRFQEGGLFSSSKINESRRRLANLWYLQEIDPKVVPVADTNNQADIDYKVKEVSAITANFQVGFGDRDGLFYAVSLTDQNLFGTGKSMAMGLNNSHSTQRYSVNYHNPYFTQDKIGFSLGGYVRKHNPNNVSGELSAYRSSECGTLASFDIPLSDYTQVDFGLGVEHTSIGHAVNLNSKADSFLSKYGAVFNHFKLVTNLSYSNLDKAIFPTSGFTHAAGASLYGPLNSHSLEFYKLSYNATWYLPLFKDFIFRAGAELGYGDGIGKTKDLPFFRNFFAGGIESIHGFVDDTITNVEADRNRVIGGNLLTLAGASIIVPSPFKDALRSSVFVDVGGVYDGRFEGEYLRSSYGLQIEWYTPLMPLKFSLSKTLRKKSWDDTDTFQFTIGFSV